MTPLAEVELPSTSSRLALPGDYSAHIRIRRCRFVDDELRARVSLTNRGRRIWPQSEVGEECVGQIRLGLRAVYPDGVADYRRWPIPRPIRPGESVHLDVEASRPWGAVALRFDLVCEAAFWFEDLGGAPLELRPSPAGRQRRWLPAVAVRPSRLPAAPVAFRSAVRFVVGSACAAQALLRTVLAWVRLRRRVEGPRPEDASVPVASEPTDAAAKGRRPRVLVVSPYSIYPENHGGAVRLRSLLRHLGERCDLYLLVLLRESWDDPEQRRALEPHCRAVFFHRWRPELSPRGWGRSPPGALLFRSRRLAARIEDLARRYRVDVVELEHTELGQYAEAARRAGAAVILVEYDIAFRTLWRRIRAGMVRANPAAAAYGESWLDVARLLLYELEAARAVDRVHVVSEEDRRFLSAHLGPHASRVRVVPNGVDGDRFRPRDPLRRAGVLFAGNYEHLPNLDAIEYFLRQIWPIVRTLDLEARLTLVGARLPPRFRQLDGVNGVSVVGEVPDMAAVYQRHRVLAVPLRGGSGTRVKLFEAFSAGLPVVSSRLGAEGIPVVDGHHLLLADEPGAFARAVVRLLRDEAFGARLATAARALAARCSWRAAAELHFRDLRELSGRRPDRKDDAPAKPLAPRRVRIGLRVSVILPTRCGGELLARCLEAILAQKIRGAFEIVCVDSGSPGRELDRMRELGARVVTIPPERFDHGLTRDLGAAQARGRVLVFLNQDAVPIADSWLEALTSALEEAGPDAAAAQGGLVEHPRDAWPRRFYWDSGGSRFYFTRETSRWLATYELGFSTVNAAIRRSAWERLPFGPAEIMEDKKWQRAAVERGWRIVPVPEAAVYHSHAYDLESLIARCAAEGRGWRLLGEPYTALDCLSDLVRADSVREVWHGLRTRGVRTPAELLFPWLRPIALWAGGVRPGARKGTAA